MIMQRLHEDDLAGVIIKLKMGFVHLMVPQEFEPERSAAKPSSELINQSGKTLGADVSFAPNSGAKADILGPPLRATSGLMRRSEDASSFDNLVGAGEQRL